MLKLKHSQYLQWIWFSLVALQQVGAGESPPPVWEGASTVLFATNKIYFHLNFIISLVC